MTSQQFNQNRNWFLYANKILSNDNSSTEISNDLLIKEDCIINKNLDNTNIFKTSFDTSLGSIYPYNNLSSNLGISDKRFNDAYIENIYSSNIENNKLTLLTDNENNPFLIKDSINNKIYLNCDISSELLIDMSFRIINNKIIFDNSLGIKIPCGDTSYQTWLENGVIRFNTSTNSFEGYNGNWINFKMEELSNDELLGNLEISNNLLVLGDASINKILEVSNNLYVLGDASINNILEVSNNFYVLGDASINNILEVSNNLLVLGDASINNILEVSNNLYVLGDASINNNLEVSNHLLVIGDASINNILEVSNNLYVLGDASVNNNLEVSNNLLIKGDVSINNMLEVSNNLLIKGDASINNILEVSNHLLVRGDASFNNNLEVSGNLKLQNLIIPTISVSQRNNLSPEIGQIFFINDYKKIQFYNGDNWMNITSSKIASYGFGTIIYEGNSQPYDIDPSFQSKHSFVPSFAPDLVIIKAYINQSDNQVDNGNMDSIKVSNQSFFMFFDTTRSVLGPTNYYSDKYLTSHPQPALDRSNQGDPGYMREEIQMTRTSSNYDEFRGIWRFENDGITIQDNAFAYGANKMYDENINYKGHSSIGGGYGVGKYIVYGWQAGGGITLPNNVGNITSNVQASETFSIITYTGGQISSITGLKIGHGLVSEPKMALIKTYKDDTAGGTEAALDSSEKQIYSNWFLYHEDMSSNDIAYLNYFDSIYKSLMDNSYLLTKENVFGNPNYGPVGNGTLNLTADIGSAGLNDNNMQYIIYAWAEKNGYSKFGSYNSISLGSSSSEISINLGFKPKIIIIKEVTDNGNAPNQAGGLMRWPIMWIIDEVRDASNSVNSVINGLPLFADRDATLNNGTRIFPESNYGNRNTTEGSPPLRYPNVSGKNFTSLMFVDNGFKFTDNDEEIYSSMERRYIYAAFKEG